MATVRHHGDVVIAASIVLALVGALGSLQALSPHVTVDFLLALAAGFASTLLARGLLDDLDTNELCFAAALMIALAMWYVHALHALRPASVVTLLLVEVGVVTAALTTRRPTRFVVLVRALGCGAAGVGWGVPGGAYLIAIDKRGIGLIFLAGFGLWAGALATTRLVRTLDTRDSALGQFPFAALLLAGTWPYWMEPAALENTESGGIALAVLAFAALGSFLCGGVGGMFGAAGRYSFEPEPEQAKLPTARKLE